MKPPLEISPIDGGQRVKIGQDVRDFTHEEFKELQHQYFLPEPDFS